MPCTLPHSTHIDELSQSDDAKAEFLKRRDLHILLDRHLRPWAPSISHVAVSHALNLRSVRGILQLSRLGPWKHVQRINTS